MRGYTSLRDVRGKSGGFPRKSGLSRPDTCDEERSCPSTLIDAPLLPDTSSTRTIRMVM